MALANFADMSIELVLPFIFRVDLQSAFVMISDFFPIDTFILDNDFGFCYQLPKIFVGNVPRALFTFSRVGLLKMSVSHLMRFSRRTHSRGYVVFFMNPSLEYCPIASIPLGIQSTLAILTASETLRPWENPQ